MRTRRFVSRGLSLASVLIACCGTQSPHPPSVTVDLQPLAPAVLPSATIDFVATVTGAANNLVSWAVLEAAGGVVNAQGHYTAPAATGTYHVVAGSLAAPGASATATITVTANAPIAVSVGPHAPSVVARGSVTFTAVVTATSDTVVTWSVQEGAPGGSVTSAGVYTAPSVAGVYHVVATSHADPTKRDTAAVTVTPGPSVVISPHTATVPTGANATFTASVGNSTDTAVVWSVAESSGGSVVAGVYTAPATAGVFHVVASAHADSTATDTATVTVVPPGVQVSPASALVIVSLPQPFTAQIVGGSGGVNWTVKEAAGGTITTGGLYSAPATAGTYHVVATSQADSTKSSTVTVTVARTGEWINVTPASITLDPTATAGSSPGFPANYGAQQVVADPANPGTFLTTFTYQGVWRSVDYGATWTKLTAGDTDLDKGRPAMEIAPDGSYLISTDLYPIGGASNGAWKSVPPLGTSWRRINIPNVPNGDDLGAFSIDKGDKNHVIGQAHTATGFFYESVDAGESWTAQALPSGTGSNTTQRLHMVDGSTLLAVYDWSSGVNPRQGKRSGTTWPWTWSWTETTTKDEAGAASAGQTKFHGEQQLFVDPLNKVNGTSVIYLGGPEGLHRSADGGLNWVKLNTPQAYSQAVVATATKLYSVASFANNTSGFPPNLMTAPRTPGTPGAQWTSQTTPAAMNNGWLHADLALLGTHYVIVGGCWNAGLWIFIEP